MAYYLRNSDGKSEGDYLYGMNVRSIKTKLFMFTVYTYINKTVKDFYCVNFTTIFNNGKLVYELPKETSRD